MRMARREVDVGDRSVDIAQEVWEATIKEVAHEWLEGPLSAEQVREKVGPLVIK